MVSGEREVIRGSNWSRASRVSIAVVFVGQLVFVVGSGPRAIATDVAFALPVVLMCDWRARRMGLAITDEALVLVRFLRTIAVPWPDIEFFYESPSGEGRSLRFERVRRRRTLCRRLRVSTLFWVNPPSRWSRWYGACELEYEGRLVHQAELCDFFEEQRIRRSPGDRRNHVFPRSESAGGDPGRRPEPVLAVPPGGGPYWACRLIMHEGRETFVRLREEPFASLRMLREWLISTSLARWADAHGDPCAPTSPGARPLGWGRILFGVDVHSLTKSGAELGLTPDAVRSWECRPSDLPVPLWRLRAYGLVVWDHAGALSHEPVITFASRRRAEQTAARWAHHADAHGDRATLGVMRKPRLARTLPDDPPLLTVPPAPGIGA
jgi:hypothetical protein